MNRVDRIPIGDKDLNRLMDALNREGFQVVAVHAIGVKFFVFSVRVPSVGRVAS